jgi:hypothetical protein
MSTTVGCGGIVAAGEAAAATAGEAAAAAVATAAGGAVVGLEAVGAAHAPTSAATMRHTAAGDNVLKAPPMPH